jgi:hypothetical protein
MPHQAGCAERLQLSEPVADAITTFYLAKAKHDAAKPSGTGDPDGKLFAAIQKAGEQQRLAEKARWEHIKHQGCKP